MKPRTDLLPAGVLLEVADLLAAGVALHADNDFSTGRLASIDYAALQRHALALWSGEDLDPTSGKSHAIHLVARALILADTMLNRPEMDDRPRGGLVPLPDIIALERALTPAELAAIRRWWRRRG